MKARPRCFATGSSAPGGPGGPSPASTSTGATPQRGWIWLDDWSPEHDGALLRALHDAPELHAVVSSREAPSLALRTGLPGSLVLALEPLSDAAARALLHTLSGEDIKTTLLFTHGHALSLTLLADADARAPSERRRLLGQLLHAFVGDGLTTTDRLAIEALAPLRYVGEQQLQRATGATPASAFELLERLRRMSFVRAEPLGLSLHPTLREIILEDLAWRAPERVRTLVQGELSVLRAELARGGALRERAVEILLDLIARAPGAWISRAALVPRAERATPDEHAEVVELIRLHEGDDAAAVCARWLAMPAVRCFVSRDDRGKVYAAGVRAVIDTGATLPELDDPLTTKALHALGDTPRRVLFNRFLVGRETYQMLNAELMPVFAEIIRDTLVTQHQAHVTVIREGGPLTPITAGGFLPMVPGSRTAYGAHAYVALGAAITSEADATLAFFSFVANQWGVAAPVAVAAAVPPQIERSVHAAVLALEDARSLGRLPLAAWLGVDGARLQSLLREAIAAVGQMPDGERARRALLAQLRTGGTQEDAAASVAMSLATYKRFRKRAEQRAAEILWAARSDG